jgi:nucleoside-diphosphate-sugar epimerase
MPPESSGRSSSLELQLANAKPTILVTGGAGYIGSVLVPRLLANGYRVRVLDLLWWGEESLARVRDRIELVHADLRELPETALEGVRAVINLAGLSNDLSAEYDPTANWQMNALATEALADACEQSGVRRLVFASSCSLYDGLAAGMHDESAAIKPRAAYALSKRYAEQALLARDRAGLESVVLRFGTVYGWSPRMRYDLVVNRFVRDALLHGKLTLHGGGRMRRPLIDVEDVSNVLISALEAPARLVAGEIFNVVSSNHLVRELALLVARAGSLAGRGVTLEETPLPRLARDYECSNAKLVARFGFAPTRSLAQAVADLLSRVHSDDPRALADPRHENIRWLELMHAGLAPQRM